MTRASTARVQESAGPPRRSSRKERAKRSSFGPKRNSPLPTTKISPTAAAIVQPCDSETIAVASTMENSARNPPRTSAK